MAKQKTNPVTTTTTPGTEEKKARKPRVSLADQLAQVQAMAEGDETVAALVPAIAAAIDSFTEAKATLKKAKRRIKKLFGAAMSGVED